MLKAEIIGLPNVGKSTLFNALRRSHKAAAENYPLVKGASQGEGPGNGDVLLFRFSV